MGRSRFDQSTQVWRSGTYDDTIAPTEAAYETNTVTLEEDLNNIRSFLHELRDVRNSNWWAALAAPSTFPGEGAAARGVQDVNDDLYDIERKRILKRRAVVSADIVVPSAVAASGVLTLTGLPLDTETVTIGTKVYTFQTVLTNVDGNVLIGATASDSLDNLIAAITLGAGSGTLYAAATTLHPTVTAAAGAGDTMDATAKVDGTAGNTIATTETLTNGSWGAATLTGGAGDVVILGAGELPGNLVAAVGNVTTRGTIVAYEANFGTATLTDVVGGDTLTPKNLCKIADSATGEPILDGSANEIHALIQSEFATDGTTITETTPNRVQLSFVVHNSTNDDLILVDGQYIGGKTIDYSPVERYAFEDIPEHAWLGDDFIDAGGGAVTRQDVYNNQGTVPVDLITNATLDLEGAGLVWSIRDDAQATLFSITEGSAGGTSTVALGGDVDVFDNNAVSNLFAGPLTVDDDGTDIEIGVTAGQINTTGTDDFELQAGGELYLDDGNRTGSTWATDGIKLSDTTAEWDLFETTFGGEVSLLNAITQAYTEQARNKVYANVITADISANTLITGAAGSPNISAQLPSYKGLSFINDVEVFINGQLQRPGVDAAANNDVYPSAVEAEQADGAFYCEYALRYRGGTDPDVVAMVVWGTPTA